VVPKVTRELTISNAMKEGFILEATTSVSGRMTHLAVIEYKEGVCRVVTSQPKEKFDHFRELKFPYKRPRM
jgi:hypothetical protein